MAKCEESLVLSRTYDGRIQAGVMLHLMGKIWLRRDGSATRLYVQEAHDHFPRDWHRYSSDQNSLRGNDLTAEFRWVSHSDKN